MKVLGGAAIASLLSVGECVDVVAEAMRSVARQAGVSTMTVSRVLSQPGSVAPETRERILQAIGAQGYVPNDVAGSLHARRARCGAVWCGVVWCGVVCAAHRQLGFQRHLAGPQRRPAPRASRSSAAPMTATSAARNAPTVGAWPCVQPASTRWA